MVLTSTAMADTTVLEEIQSQFRQDLRAINVEISENQQGLMDLDSRIENFQNGANDTKDEYPDLKRVCDLGCNPEMKACTEAAFRSAFALMPDEELRYFERLNTSAQSSCGAIVSAHPDFAGLSASCASAAKKCVSARNSRIRSFEAQKPGYKARIEQLGKRRTEVLLQFAEVLSRLGYRADIDQSKPDWRNQRAPQQDYSGMLNNLCLMLDSRMGLEKEEGEKPSTPAR